LREVLTLFTYCVSICIRVLLSLVTVDGKICAHGKPLFNLSQRWFYLVLSELWRHMQHKYSANLKANISMHRHTGA
jgi:hypothetical protein